MTPDAHSPTSWLCPATVVMIDDGLCWEYCFAESYGPTTTRNDLRRWIATSRRFASLKEFHAVCASCPHCQWSDRSTCR